MFRGRIPSCATVSSASLYSILFSCNWAADILQFLSWYQFTDLFRAHFQGPGQIPPTIFNKSPWQKNMHRSPNQVLQRTALRIPMVMVVCPPSSSWRCTPKRIEGQWATQAVFSGRTYLATWMIPEFFCCDEWCVYVVSSSPHHMTLLQLLTNLASLRDS